MEEVRKEAYQTLANMDTEKINETCMRLANLLRAKMAQLEKVTRTLGPVRLNLPILDQGDGRHR